MNEIKGNTEANNVPAKSSFFSSPGILLAMLSGFGFAASNVFMKLSRRLSPGDHGLVRYTILFVCLLIVIKYKKLNIFGPTEHVRLLIARSVLGTVTVISFFFSITLISPADALTIVHSNILITALFARIFIKEKLMLAHLIALFLTINGIIFISKPPFLFNKINERNQTILMLNQTTTPHLYEQMKPFLGKQSSKSNQVLN